MGVMWPQRSVSLRPPRPDFAVGLEAFYHHIPLGLVLPKISEESLVFGVVLSDPPQAALDPAVNISRVKSQTQVEDLPVVAVVVSYGASADETLIPSPARWPFLDTPLGYGSIPGDPTRLGGSAAT